ncbi:hypothetical protein DCO57_20365 [Labrenzia sp. 011]|nr:hypothetical protein DCO57_20365 [Labrenzia sp. 011]
MTPEGKEGNWIQIVPGKSRFIILRMFGLLDPWLNKTWRPSEIYSGRSSCLSRKRRLCSDC